MPTAYVVPTTLSTTTNNAVGSPIPHPAGYQGDAYYGKVHGDFYAANKNGAVFSAQATAKTVPVVAANMASVFSVYNPIGNSKVLELISAEVGVVLATTVVDVVGLHYEKFTSAPTYTAGTPISNLLGSGNLPTAVYCTALTHVAMGTGATARCAQVTGFPAVTSTAVSPAPYFFNGRVLVPAGVAVSFAVSTTVWTTTGMDLSLTWAEWPA